MVRSWASGVWNTLHDGPSVANHSLPLIDADISGGGGDASCQVMSVIGLTGGVGMGKSTVASWLAQGGVEIVDTDLIAREVTQPGAEALHEIVGEFGLEMLSPEGQLDRARMADLVFRERQALRRLESILHPRIREVWQRRVAPYRCESAEKVVVVIPLLYETRSEGEFDQVISVACRGVDQRHRLRGRGWSEEQIETRIENQWPIERKIAAASVMIWTSCDQGFTRRQLARINGLGWNPHSERKAI